MAWRAEPSWPEVTEELIGWLVESWWMQVLADWMTLVHRRIVGRWICQES